MSNRAERRQAARRTAARVPTPAPPTATRPMTPAPTTAIPSPTEDAEPEALVVTHYVDAADLAPETTIRLTGERMDGPGTFSQEDRISGLSRDGGPGAITSWVYGLTPGRWAVTAAIQGTVAERARWSWRRWSLSPEVGQPLTTRWALLAPLARIPGVIPGIWPLLGVIAVILAILVQRLMLPHEGVDVPVSVSLVALVAGLAGAKIWYALLHPGPWPRALLGGWAVDGFLAVAPIVAVITLLVFGLPVAAFLDAITPGLFVAVAVGRIGCFLAGCCAGRVTGSRFGVWSSDRKVMARRIPAQFLESAAGLAIAIVAALVILGHFARPDGALFLASRAVYFLARHGLLRLRAERREFLWRRTAALTRT